MNQSEKEVIDTLPGEYRPLSAWNYFGYTLLFSLPIIGFICLLVCACSSSNINRRSFARSYFCGILLVAIVVGVIVVFGGGIGALMELLTNISGNFPQ